MTIADALLPEFDQEMQTTRAMLERVPEEKADWAPHPKSMTLGSLAFHIACLPGWAIMTLTEKEFDVAAPSDFAGRRFTTTAEALDIFDKGVEMSRQALAGSTDEDMRLDWTFRNGEHVVFSRPRAAVMRSAVLSHIIHHRAQLGVYLRMLDIELPMTYGPTADSQMMAAS